MVGSLLLNPLTLDFFMTDISGIQLAYHKHGIYTEINYSRIQYATVRSI